MIPVMIGVTLLAFAVVNLLPATSFRRSSCELHQSVAAILSKQLT